MKDTKDTIVAIDFDNTITTRSSFPNTGQLNLEAFDFIQKVKQLGCKIVLNTSRIGRAKQEAIELCEKWKIPLDGVAKNKICAMYYIEDRSHRLYEIDFNTEYKNIEEILKSRLWEIV